MKSFKVEKNDLLKYAYVYGGEGNVKQVVLDFHGLGCTELYNEPSEYASLCGDRGSIYIFPYYGPWSWMNDTAVKLVDAIVEAVYQKYELPAGLPLISTGGSMGGLSALIYTRYARKTPAACAVNCPVCDLLYHSTEREDLPRTIYQAFAHYEEELEGAVRSASPLHQIGAMPFIPYYIVHGDADKAVNKERHSDLFAAAMKAAGHRVEYREVAGMGHCDLPGEEKNKYWDFIFGGYQR